MNILICDDNVEFMQSAKMVIQRFDKNGDYFFECVRTGKEFVETIKKQEDYDIILMDIELENENGIDVIKQSEEYLKNSHVVFISGLWNYLTDVYEVKHFAYILKNELENRIPWLLEKIEEKIRKQKNTIVVQSRGNTRTMIPVEKIAFMERDRRNTFIYSEGQVYRTTAKLDEILGQLDDKNIIRCHNSYAVNLEYVKSYNRTEFTMNDGAQIPISRSRQKEIKMYFMEWMSVQESVFG